MLGRFSRSATQFATLVRSRPVAVVIFVVIALGAPVALAAVLSPASPQSLRTASPFGRATQGDDGGPPVGKPKGGVAQHGGHAGSEEVRPQHPQVLHLKKARGAVFDVRTLVSNVVKQERPEPLAPGESATEAPVDPAANAPSGGVAAPLASAPASAPDSSFEGLDFANWGQGHPPDTNGDVGPNYYIQTINVSMGIYDKATGSRVAAFTFNSFMSQGAFGNLCDTNNFGDPVVLYDTFEDRWFVSDFAFALDGSGNVNPPHAYQCFAVSKTSDPVTGGWNFYSIEAPGGLGDYPKFGIGPDGIYMSANMFGYASGASYQAFHAWAINKQQMYNGDPTVQVADFFGTSGDFTVIPANARLQTGTPPAGSPEYFVSTEQFLNGLSIYKLKVDWDKISTSTFTGPDIQLAPTCWPNSTPASASTPANAADVLAIRAMAQAQYSNLGGNESLWVSHTVQRGEVATATCGATSTNNATVRWYQANVTGGTVAANVTQGRSFDPEGANTFFRFMPSVAVDRAGDMAVGYTKSSSTTNPQLKYAGRLAGDPVNTFSQGEQTLIDGTGAQSGNCGGAPCTRWGDYSGMALDPNGCEFWQTGEYFAVTGLNHQTRIGSFHFPGCTTVGNGTVSGIVQDSASHALAGATVRIGSRSVNTSASGAYSFTVPAGTYQSVNAEKSGYAPQSAASVAVPDGGTTTRNFTLAASASSGCFTDNSQSTFQRGAPANCDLVKSPGNIVLSNPDNTAAKNDTVNPTGFGFNSTSWAGQTFTPTVSGQLKGVDIGLFCSACSGANPNITVSLRSTSGSTPVPTGGDLATATLTGFNDGGAGGLKSVTFATPPTVTAGTRYALVFRSVTNRTTGTGVYAYTCSCSAGSGSVDSNPYTSGQRVTSTNSGSTWAADTTVGGRDLNFRTYINPGFTSAGTFISSLKDASPALGRTPTWTTLTWTATTPASTGVKLQIAASNNSAGPFAFVGPDGTSSTFFTSGSASLSQFNGFRYLKYEAFLSTSDSSVTPSLSSVQVCFVDTGVTSLLTVDPANGIFGGTTDLSATLAVGALDPSGKQIDFSLNGAPVGSAITDDSGVAQLADVDLTGINAGSYPNGVNASFAGDSSLAPSNGTAALSIAKAEQEITVATSAPSSAVYDSQFTVAATAGASGSPVIYGSSGACSNVDDTFKMTSGTGTCSVTYDEAGNGNYENAPQITETVDAVKAAQAVAFSSIAPSGAHVGDTYHPAATPGASSSPVVLAASGACDYDSGTGAVSMPRAGTCALTADQAGDDNYDAAPQATQSFDVARGAQVITVLTHAPSSAVFNTQFTVSATGGASGNSVQYGSSGTCTNAGTTFTMRSGTGTCSVTFDQAGDANYEPATQVIEFAAAAKAPQAITITTHAPAAAHAGDSYQPQATGGGSGNPVVFGATGACSWNGGTGIVTFTAAGPCTVTADQAGDANYDQAPQVSESLVVGIGSQLISIATHAPGTAVYGSVFTVSASGGGSGNPIAYGSAGSCSNSGATFTMTSGTGTCTVTYDQAGNASYNAAPQIAETVNAAKASQTIAFVSSAPLGSHIGDLYHPQAVGGGSGNPVVLTATGACKYDAGTGFVTTTGTGTCTIIANQAGNGNYDAAPPVSQSFTVGTPSLPGLFGLFGVTLNGKDDSVDSFNSAAGAYGSGNSSHAASIGSNGDVAVGSSAVYGDVRSANGAVTLQKTGSVSGDVTAGTTISGNGTIGGASHANSPSTPFAVASVDACSPVAGDLTLSAGKTLTLAAGTYCYRNISLANGASIQVTGAVVIKLTGTLTANPGAFVNPATSPASLQIISSYTGAGGIILTGGSSSYLSIYAPGTDVTLSGGSFYGTFVGRTITATAGTAIHVDLH